MTTHKAHPVNDRTISRRAIVAQLFAIRDASTSCGRRNLKCIVVLHPFEYVEFVDVLFPLLHRDGLGQLTISAWQMGLEKPVQASEEEV